MRPREYAENYLKRCAQRLKLVTWHVCLGEDLDSTEEKHAACEWTDHEATIRFADTFWNGHAEFKRRCVAHELAHLITADLWRYPEKLVTSLEEVLPKRAHAVLMASWHAIRETADEEVVNHLETLLAELLPEWNAA